MKNALRCAASLAVLVFVACEPDANPAAPAPLTVRAAAEPLAIGTGAFFALDVLAIPNPDVSVASMINNAGQIVGQMSERDGDFFYDPEADVFVEIPKIWTLAAYGVRVNEVGVVSGTTGCETLECTVRPYTWTNDGGVKNLDFGLGRSVATAINDAGTVVGHSGSVDGGARAAMWHPDGSLEELDVAGIGTPDLPSAAWGINDAGHIVGNVGTIPVLWKGGPAVRLADLEDAIDAIAPGDLESIAPTIINNVGDILGSWRSSEADWRNLFLWTADGTLIDFNSMLDLGDRISASMNDHGEVVFTIVEGPVGSSTLKPWFWSADAGFVALPTLDPDRTLAGYINDHGVITGRSEATPLVWRPLTSADEGLEELEETLDDVLSGGTEPEGANGLRAKLQQIREHLEAGRANAAKNQLAAFVRQVEAMIADGRLSADDGAALLADAAGLAGLLS